MPNIHSNAALPGSGRLQVDALALETGSPAPGAVVRVTPHGERERVIEELVSDSSGQTPVIELPAPPVDYSMSPSDNQPYSEYDVAVYMDGFDRVYVDGVQILPDTASHLEVRLRPSARPDIDRALDIDSHRLWGDFPPHFPEPDVKPLPSAGGFMVLPEPVVPEFVVVHAGRPENSSAPNYWVTFADYIKNVASSEIYATWPVETIKANVLAIISFTLNRVYTEWYRGKGYNFTITNSTSFDHSYNYGRNIFDEISRVVDELFTTYITRPNIRQPLLAQYCDGKQIQCPGMMTQWGSKALGDQGYSAIDILKRYYGYDIVLAYANKVSGTPSSYPGSPLETGSSGENVRVVQEQLNAVSNHYPAIKKQRVDGVFGDGTRDAVVAFQKIFHLAPDGAGVILGLM